MVKKLSIPIKAARESPWLLAAAWAEKPGCGKVLAVLVRVAWHFAVEQTFHCGKIEIIALALVTVVFVGGLNLPDNFLRNWL